MPGHFVFHQMGVSVTCRRPNPGNNRDRAFTDLVEKRFPKVRVKNRLRDGELCPGINFPAEPVDFAFSVESRRVQPHADDRIGRRFDGLAAFQKSSHDDDS